MAGRAEAIHLWSAYRPGKRRRLPWRGEKHWALRDVSLVAEPGDVLGVIGANGSGKTTLLQTIAGVLRPTRGTVTVEGRIGSLIDLTAGFHRDLTGDENLVISAALLGLRRAELRARRDAIKAFAGLDEDILAEPLSTYSAGTVLRLAFSLAVSSAPDVVVLDEVLAAGDAVFQAKCMSAVCGLRDAGSAVVLASHDLDLVTKHCDRVALLDRGLLVAVGEPAAVVERYHQLDES